MKVRLENRGKGDGKNVQSVATLAQKLASSNKRDIHLHVFSDKNGKPIDDHLDRLWNRAERKAGVRHRRSYQLRHTFATMCIIRGVKLPYVAKIGGWSTIDVLIRNYTGWIDSHTKEQDDQLKELFKAQPTTSPKEKSGEKAG